MADFTVPPNVYFDTDDAQSAFVATACVVIERPDIDRVFVKTEYASIVIERPRNGASG